jgi:hypothetical protein
VAQTLATAMKRDLNPAAVRGETPARETGSAGLIPVHAATSA